MPEASCSVEIEGPVALIDRGPLTSRCQATIGIRTHASHAAHAA
jgi:hypothetical protein